MISTVEIYKSQHKIILSLCDALIRSAELCILEKETSHFESIQHTLDEILTLHLNSEDEYFYPCLAKEGDKEVRRIAQQFQIEMAETTDVYMAYKSRYNKAEYILKESDLFVKNTVDLVQALKTRIEKEEKELYSLLP